MEMTYTVTTEKGEFALVREEFTEIGIAMNLPEFLCDMSEEDLSMAYPSQGIPLVAKSNAERKVAFILNAITAEASDEKDEEAHTLKLFANQKNVLSRLVPGYHEYGVKSKKIDEHTVVCLEYASYALNDDMYNVFFLLVHGGKMVYGAFSGLLEELYEMSLVFLTCLNSLKFIG